MFKDQVHNGYYESDYMLEDPAHDFIIDAADPKSCLGRYANDSLSMKKSNCKFAFYDDPFSGYLQATKAIKKGEEIYVSYGNTMVKITGKMLLIRMPNHTHHYLRKIKTLLTSNYFNHIYIITIIITILTVVL